MVVEPRNRQDFETDGVRAVEAAFFRHQGASLRRARLEAAAMRWTEEQDEVLRECAHLGAEAAAAAIRRRCRARHSVRAVEMRASRIRCSLARLPVCAGCGAVGVSLNRQTRMCPLCTERYHLEQERAFAEVLEAERAAAEDEAAVAAVRRERDRLRQRNSRTCRRYGLASRRERMRGGDPG